MNAYEEYLSQRAREIDEYEAWELQDHELTAMWDWYKVHDPGALEREFDYDWIIQPQDESS